MKSKIMVVEDTYRDFEFLKNTLKKENYEIIYAQDGRDALSLLEKDTPDLVILDILLPDIDGFEVCKRIKENKRFVNLPVLFYSVIKTVDEKLLGLETGASDFLSKSADPRELLIRVRNLLKAKRQIDETIKFSFYDTITNVYNRRYFQHRLNDECIRSRRYQRAFSCLMIDVDHFKKINNNFGRATGDRVLKKVAETLSLNIRSADEICRYEEDKFGVLLPETDLRGAYSAAERIRHFIAMSDAVKTECQTNLTVSCGVSAFNKNINDTHELVDQANRALSEAKLEGRNQTIAYSQQFGNTYLDNS